MDAAADAAGDVGAGNGPGEVAAGERFSASGAGAAGLSGGRGGSCGLGGPAGLLLAALLLLELGDLLLDQLLGVFLRLLNFASSVVLYCS